MDYDRRAASRANRGELGIKNGIRSSYPGANCTEDNDCACNDHCGDDRVLHGFQTALVGDETLQEFPNRRSLVRRCQHYHSTQLKQERIGESAETLDRFTVQPTHYSKKETPLPQFRLHRADPVCQGKNH